MFLSKQSRLTFFWKSIFQKWLFTFFAPAELFVRGASPFSPPLNTPLLTWIMNKMKIMGKSKLLATAYGLKGKVLKCLVDLCAKCGKREMANLVLYMYVKCHK